MPSINILAHSPNEKTHDLGTVHLLPCTIKHDGPAPVSTYFIPENDTNGRSVSHFRGRMLQGREYPLPENVQGIVFSESSKSRSDSVPSSKMRKTAESNATTSEPSKVWHIPRTLEWVKIASAIHQ